MFEDKINSMKEASLFALLTKTKKRKDMGIEAFKIWARIFLKKIIKPEFYIMVAINISEMEMNAQNRRYFGKIVDGILELLDKESAEANKAAKIDAIVKKYLSMLYRNRFRNRA